MTFQHGCPHHWKAPGTMSFLNLSINQHDDRITVAEQNVFDNNDNIAD